MKYLTLRNGWYVYNRRVPFRLKHLDPRQRVRVALKTRCERTAIKEYIKTDKSIENYWKSLIDLQKRHSNDRFKALVETARQSGLSYVGSKELVNIDFIDLLSRVLTSKQVMDRADLVETLLGSKEEKPKLVLSEALSRFWQYSKPLTLNKNKEQIRKWKNPRIKAVTNFITCVGDLNISDINNLDLVKFRDYWLQRMKSDGIKADTVNKDFTHLKGILETVSIHEGLDLEIEKIFKKIHLREVEKNTRTAYQTAFIKTKIFNPETLKALDKEARDIAYICANTGARPIEIVNVVKEDIILDAPIPYIYIRSRNGYSLKTRESERKLPMTGKVLEIFTNYPNGFMKYRGNSDRATSTINRWLTKFDLRPTKGHSLYSFRHSFQDRLNALELPDRIQCQLMGHKYQRPKYGQGASIKHLQTIMKRIDLFK